MSARSKRRTSSNPLSQTTTLVEHMPATAKVHAVDAKLKWKAKEVPPNGGSMSLTCKIDDVGGVLQAGSDDIVS